MARTDWVVLVVSAGLATASYPSVAEVDQRNLISTEFTFVTPIRSSGQSFTVGVAGLLTGIEVAPALDTSEPGDEIFLVLFDNSTGYSRGYVSLSAENFSSDFPPPPLSLDATGPGYFDVSALNVIVDVGDSFRFDIRHGAPAGVCDLDSHICTVGRVGVSCSEDTDCHKSIALGSSDGSSYPPGVRYSNGQSEVGFDLTFKTFVNPGICPDEFDQANLSSTGNVVVGPTQYVGQSVTVGSAGLLTGFEFAPLLDSSDAGDQISLEVFDGLGQSVGSVSISASGFPPGSGIVPAPLSACANGPGFVDISGLGMEVGVGDQLYFELRHGAPPGNCNQTTHLCTQGRVGLFCFDDFECHKQIRAGISGDAYASGTASVNGLPFSGDLAFKTVVDGAPCSTDVDQFNLAPIIATLSAEPMYTVGQSFTVGAAGWLTAIEFAARLRNSAATDQITVELFDGEGQSLGAVEVSAVDISPGSGNPDPLSLCDPGPGFADVSGLGVNVTVGEHLAFEIRHDAHPGVCDSDLQICTDGEFGADCRLDYDCDKVLLIGRSGDTYAGGTALVNGAPYLGSPADLAFKTFVVPEPSAAASLISGIALLAWLCRRRCRCERTVRVLRSRSL